MVVHLFAFGSKVFANSLLINLSEVLFNSSFSFADLFSLVVVKVVVSLTIDFLYPLCLFPLLANLSDFQICYLLVSKVLLFHYLLLTTLSSRPLLAEVAELFLVFMTPHLPLIQTFIAIAHTCLSKVLVPKLSFWFKVHKHHCLWINLIDLHSPSLSFTCPNTHVLASLFPLLDLWACPHRIEVYQLLLTHRFCFEVFQSLLRKTAFVKAHYQALYL